MPCSSIASLKEGRVRWELGNSNRVQSSLIDFYCITQYRYHIPSPPCCCVMSFGNKMEIHVKL